MPPLVIADVLLNVVVFAKMLGLPLAKVFRDPAE
jgi:hypothetical protein